MTKIITIPFKAEGIYEVPLDCRKVLNVWMKGYNIHWEQKEKLLFVTTTSAWTLLSMQLHGKFDDKITIRYLTKEKV